MKQGCWILTAKHDFHFYKNKALTILKSQLIIVSDMAFDYSFFNDALIIALFP